MRNQLSILSLDLGNNLGWSRNVCTLRPDVLVNAVDHGTIYLDDLTDQRMKKEYNDIFSRSRVRMNIYEESIRKLIDLMKFDCYITEDVFCMPTRIASFKVLTIYMETLEKIVNMEKLKKLYTVSPTVIKKHISGYGQSDKTQVQAALLNNPHITMKHPERATEHEFDSVAGCYAFVHEYLLTAV